MSLLSNFESSVKCGERRKAYVVIFERFIYCWEGGEMGKSKGGRVVSWEGEEGGRIVSCEVGKGERVVRWQGGKE